jgi:hypothetical protein
MATQHDCGGPVFGRLTLDGSCQRCTDLSEGAPPVQWNIRRKYDRDTIDDIRRHKCADSNCGPVCTFGQW